MTDLLGHIGASVTIVKGLLEISRDFNNAVVVKHVADLNYQLAQAQIKAAEQDIEIRELKTELNERKNNPLHYSGTVYLDNDNHTYCPACYDDKGKRIHLKATHNRNVPFTCPVCNVYFEDG